jgi:hypothetical protein
MLDEVVLRCLAMVDSLIAAVVDDMCVRGRLRYDVLKSADMGDTV